MSPVVFAVLPMPECCYGQNDGMMEGQSDDVADQLFTAETINGVKPVLSFSK